MPIPPNQHALKSASPLGFDGDPVPGDPRVLQQVVDDFTYLRDVAWSVCQGLDAVVASASSGGFEGEVADALRQVVSGRLKVFVFDMARAFSLAGEAVAVYRAVVVAGRLVVGDAVVRAAGLGVGDLELAGLRGQVQEQVDRVGDAARVMEVALRDAAQLVSQPVRVPVCGSGFGGGCSWRCRWWAGCWRCCRRSSTGRSVLLWLGRRSGRMRRCWG